MRITLPGVGTLLDRLNFAVPVRDALDSLTGRAEVIEQDVTALAESQALAYVVPEGGIPADDLAPGALAGNLPGSPTNPHTDGTVRNSALLVNYYDTPTDPTAWQINDVNFRRGT